ncbi:MULTISPECIES: bifunctional metallophosphatase/5'-nucleotidase [Streptomyces]|uniref:Bifunctional metallophosphatase/5'-nucleotidase n=1 Tax=Streptomyces venezuelae TaxID=54571 RepID=A0A5P2BC97_STRVZ|nr:bifunctional metallophosphatase/5'-nucleotidase [Streptomyces venezuelae]MYY82838.1 bifunctional metallophosphatase/5'-nucleotidase [Streptomyces sp. SID335]MYZ17151.1 bifunctional metallophosphatase/5'-nucleotidase [Streptomyces sp. SID337]NDZ88795.1 bifunctional metallophosphatase/5'-nucleotidase [Streptomyces sp. SID10115]NEA05918.1 bifunctional metallophosphatase/5'-nucleotidase [Streptomyces sp. SID10116]NEB42966.1 bifunctional metallophosphatase/5'-nucleotidase [Streptomyces sp. SID33
MSAIPKHRRPRRRATRVLAVAAGLATVGALAASLPASAGQDHPGGGSKGKHSRTVDVQLLSFNDFHGNLQPPAGSSGQVTERQADGSEKKIDAGGVEYLATSLRTARKGNPYSVTAAAGDLIGASPLLSGLFHDEPTVEAMNKLDLDVTSVGNHEFDEGAKELARMQNGGCHPKDGCFEKGKGGKEKKFEGADYPYLAANVTDEKTGKPILKPYWVWKHKGVKVGFIGVTLEGTPDIVSADGVKGLKFHDEIETVNKYAKILDKQGVKSIVTLIHEGGVPKSQTYNYDCDSPGAGDGISGPVTTIAKGITPKVDALVTGHTHNAYVCTIPDPAGKPRMVTSASSFGKLYTDTTLTYDRKTKDIVRTSVRSANHVVSREQAKAPDMTSLISRWDKLAAPVANKAVGYVSGDIPGRGAGVPESPLGDLISDAQLAHAKSIDPEADLALMNPGGIRSDIVYKASGSEGDGVVTYGEAFTVQPFSNTVNLVDLTGAQLVTGLKQQVSGSNEASPKILQVSQGLTYTLDMTKTGADRVVADSIKLNGKAIDPAATYRVAMNSFLAGGGDGFAELGKGTKPVVGSDDLKAFNDYLTANSSADKPIAPPKADRITIVK